MNRRCIRLLIVLTLGACSAVSCRAQLCAYNPAVLSVGAKDGNHAAHTGGLNLSGSGERWQFTSLGVQAIDIGVWLIQGRILENQLEALALLGHFGVGALVIIGLGFIAFVSRERQVLRRRIRSQRISPQELHRMISSENTPLIIDLRSPLDMLPDPRMIPGAIRLTQEEISAAAPDLPSDRDIVLYSTCPERQTSIDAALMLVHTGLTRVRLLSGGFRAWKQLGYELEDAIDKKHSPPHAPAATGPQTTVNVVVNVLTFTSKE